MAYLDQLDPADREAFRIFGDATIDPLERERRIMALGQPAAPDMRLALNDGAGGGPPVNLPDVPPAAGVAAESAGGTTGLPAQGPAPTSVTAPTDTGQLTGNTPGSERAYVERQYSHLRGGVPAEVKAAHPEAYPEAAATDIPVSLDEETEGPQRPGAGPARPQFDIPFASVGGGQVIPSERVSESATVRQGTMSPEQRAAHTAALEAGEAAQNDLGALAMQQEQRDREIDVRRREAEMAERERLAAIRSAELQKAQRVSEQAARISDEVLNQDVADESLFAGQDFGGKLLTFVGILGMGLGTGLSGNTQQLIPTLQAMARREADKQRRYTELQQGKLNTLGTIYERHMQNYQNADLAFKATQADILAKAEFEHAKAAKDAGPAADQAKLAADSAALRAAVIEAQANRDKALGDLVETSVQRQYAQPRVVPKPAAPAPAAPAERAKPRLEDFGSEAEYFRALADYEEPEALDASVREATGQPAPGGKSQRSEVTALPPDEEQRFRQWAKKSGITDVDARDSHYDYRGFWREHGDVPVRFGVDHFPDTYKQHGHPTFSVESKYSAGPNDGGRWDGERFIPSKGTQPAGKVAASKAPPGMVQVSAREDGGEAPGPGKLLDAGRYREAIDQLPEKTRQGLEQQATRIKKELGDKATMADARVLAAQRFLGWPTPKGYVFQHARDRAVKDAGGNMIYAIGDNPTELKKSLTATNQLTSALALSLRAASKPSTSWSPEERAALGVYANLNAPQIAVALGQGAMGDQEKELYLPPAGGDVNGVADWIAGTGKAKVETALKIFRDRRRVLLESFSRDPFDYVPVGAR